MGKIKFIKKEKQNGIELIILEDKGAMSTKEVEIEINLKQGTVRGDMLAYGSWHELEQDEIEEYLQELRKLGHIK